MAITENKVTMMTIDIRMIRTIQIMDMMLIYKY
jgi:hypothetical protein